MVELVIENSVNEFVSAGFTGKPDELISLLQFIQKTDGFISFEGARKIALFLGISEAQVYAVATFYSQFRFHKPGESHVRVCLGTACHVQGGGELSREVQDVLGIQSRETTPDGRFDFEEVACLGCCAQAAVVEVNGKIYAKMSREKLRGVLEENGLA
ncbi:MAG: NAD(P)H-dependent oxidoreductase subunit E [Anaerolineaceae bacterium]|nr:NAD(P)H-dependent oxidoreductase subunit E [Anaerolineaceae bacterium]